MAPLCSSNEGSTHRKCPGVDTRSVRRASGLLETRFSSLDSRMVGNSETIVRSTSTKAPNHSSRHVRRSFWTSSGVVGGSPPIRKLLRNEVLSGLAATQAEPAAGQRRLHS
jgi:hypothetical protein